MESKDAGQAFLAYVGAIVGALAAGQAISLVSRYGADEIAGRLEAAHATGIRPWRLLLSWWLTASLGAGLSLAAAALVAWFRVGEYGLYFLVYSAYSWQCKSNAPHADLCT